MKKKFKNRIEHYNEKGELHRDKDLPAIKYNDGEKLWYQNGLRHRLDGPAYERSDGEKQWYQNDLLHRLDGPAIEWNDGYKNWYYQGEQIQCSSTEEFMRIIKLKAFW